jgi:hypothetical protein
MGKHSTNSGKPAQRLQKRIDAYEDSVNGRSSGSYPQSASIRNTLRKPGSRKK